MDALECPTECGKHFRAYRIAPELGLTDIFPLS